MRHAADINVVGPLALASALTLQNGAGGNIRLAAPITTPQLGLISAGNITQASGASIVAGAAARALDRRRRAAERPGQQRRGRHRRRRCGRTLRVHRCRRGDAGRGPGHRLRRREQSAAGAAGHRRCRPTRVFVRTLAGDLSLATNVTQRERHRPGGTAARFQNLGAYTITGAPWRVWADTWVGETRGGLAGSGPLPNLYHCAYLGLCTVSIPAGANHFIYAQQPRRRRHRAQRRAARRRAESLLHLHHHRPDPRRHRRRLRRPFLSSPATPFSLPGLYAISGGFISAEGYAVSVVPGAADGGRHRADCPSRTCCARAEHLAVRPQHRAGADLPRDRAARRRPRRAGRRRAGTRMVARALAAQSHQLHGHRAPQRLRRFLSVSLPRRQRAAEVAGIGAAAPGA